MNQFLQNFENNIRKDFSRLTMNSIKTIFIKEGTELYFTY